MTPAETPTPDHVLTDVVQVSLVVGQRWRCGCTCGYFSPFADNPAVAHRAARAHQSAMTTTVTHMRLMPAAPEARSHYPTTLTYAQGQIDQLRAQLNTAATERNRLARTTADIADERDTARQDRDRLQRDLDIAHGRHGELAHQLAEITRVVTGHDNAATWTDAIGAARTLRHARDTALPLLDAVIAWRYAEPDERDDDALVDVFDTWTMQ